MRNSSKALTGDISDAEKGSELYKKKIKVSRGYLIGFLSFKKVASESTRLKNGAQATKISSIRQRKYFGQLRKPTIYNSVVPDEHEIWRKNECEKSITDSAQIQLGAKQLTYQLRKKMSRIYTPLSSRSGTSSAMAKLNDLTKSEDSIITLPLDKSLGTVSPKKPRNQSDFGGTCRRSISSLAAFVNSNTTKSKNSTEMLLVQNFSSNFGSNLSQKEHVAIESLTSCANKLRNQLRHQTSSLAHYDHDHKNSWPVISMNRYRQTECYENDIKQLSTEVLPQNKIFKPFLSPNTHILCSRKISNGKLPEANQKEIISSQTHRLLCPMTPSHAPHRYQTRRAVSTNSIPKMQPMPQYSIGDPDFFVESSSSPVTMTSNSARHIHTAQQNAFWCGRFMSLHDRFHNDMLDTLVVDDKTYTRFQDNTILTKQTEISPEDTEYIESNAGLQYLSDEEIRRCKKSFIHLGALCVTDEAKQSLWNFQLAFARYRNEKLLLPSGGELEDKTLYSIEKD
ncbi:hypothetical protein K3495_g9628 [Podosphaera aphanis]|nr:hypothetical protein K3495_g9628 [Podosphaera aphanis]